MKKFCDIQSRNELADYLSVPRNKLTHILYVKKPDSYYTTFEIPKRNGETRTICAPSGDLKTLQEKLSNMLWLYQKSIWEEKGIKPNISHAFEKGKSIITNAKIHRNKRFVLNLDLENFFDRFHFGRVQGYFEKNNNFKLPHDVAVVLAQLTCYQGRLPQGAPSSPIITNLICQPLDTYLLKIAKKYKLDYTRYADDLTFSTNDRHFVENQENFLAEANAAIKRASFSINEKKTRLQFKDSRQEVTGLIVNKKLNVNHAYVRKTRAMAHQLYSTGEYLIDGEPGTIKQLEGRFSFIDQLDRYNNVLDPQEIKHDAFHLNGRERQYQAFIFYKYLFAHNAPVIVTEGKTDIRYIKAALKSLYAKYPRLIQKDAEGNFIYKFSFFRRTKRWKYLFGISLDGADAMKILYRYHVGNGKKIPAYLGYFRQLSGGEQHKPVILLYDNEPNSDRPLKKFLGEDVHPTADQKAALKENLHMRLIPDSKLFVVTPPLVGDKEECEIEDLFADELLKLSLEGKTFCRKDKFDNSKYFEKEIFSQYVYENYQKIDFSGFIPLLDVIDSIIAQTESAE
ncbi:retron Ec67 family RNA-directed DNA polymerase/endonuclease [Lawsonibacter celer]|uniref:retron Ec67 family RNA-directed DNA polymerase/endonuclease n=1 Tax=Lawsonibacter celer TaxID=2986526 RepID=UPI001648E783|nr:retron Ec67 family RNA-directed DNA polymerase/endonuclease [Lawsonibacter celer]